MTDRYAAARAAHPGEQIYRMGDELIPESGMQQWHNDRGLPWGRDYRGPDPITIRRMQPAGGTISLPVHLANEHGTDPENAVRGTEIEHMHAHLTGTYRPGQEHYHRAATQAAQPEDAQQRQARELHDIYGRTLEDTEPGPPP